jgi:hypothetical protein
MLTFSWRTQAEDTRAQSTTSTPPFQARKLNCEDETPNLIVSINNAAAQEDLSSNELMTPPHSIGFVSHESFDPTLCTLDRLPDHEQVLSYVMDDYWERQVNIAPLDVNPDLFEDEYGFQFGTENGNLCHDKQSFGHTQQESSTIGTTDADHSYGPNSEVEIRPTYSLLVPDDVADNL